MFQPTYTYLLPEWVAKDMKPHRLIPPSKIMQLKLNNNYCNERNQKIYEHRMVLYEQWIEKALEFLGPCDYRILWLRANPPESPPPYNFEKFVVGWARLWNRPPKRVRKRGLTNQQASVTV